MVDSVNVSRRHLLRSVSLGISGTALLSGTASAAANQTERLVVGAEDERTAANVKNRAERVVREVDFGERGCGIVGEFPTDRDQTVQEAGVRYVEADVEVRALAQDASWGVERIGAAIAHDSGRTGEGAHIAIVDTGIDSDHPDLRANLGRGYAVESCDGDCGHDWDDDHSHGTHCAGIAGALSNDNGVVGVSTNATLHAVKVLDKRGSGTASGVAEGITWAADQGFDVISMSLGAHSPSSIIADAVQYAHDRGALLVGAAGNDGPCEDCVHYPGAFPEVMAVNSVTADDELSEFCSTGPEVEIAAPGSDIRSTVVGGYASFSGTSMATPHVAGAGALLMAGGLSNREARTRLRNTAEELGYDGRETGAGLLDVAAATNAGGGGGGGSEFDVTTVGVTGVDTSVATLSGRLVGLGDRSSATVGFEYWVDGERESTVETVTVGERSSPQGFRATVDGLEHGTSYAFAAFAADGESRISGGTRTFTTDSGSALTVETRHATIVDDDEVELTGEMTDLGDAEEVDVGFEYWVVGAKDETREEEYATELSHASAFDETVDGLESATTYKAVAYSVSESDHHATGNPIEFITPGEHEAPFSVETNAPDDVDDSGADFHGELTDVHDIDEVDVGFEYWVEDREDETLAVESAGTLDEADDFSELVLGLESDTTYVVSAFAVSDDDERATGDEVEFTTHRS